MQPPCAPSAAQMAAMQLKQLLQSLACSTPVHARMPFRALIQLCLLAEGSGSNLYTYSSKDSPFSFTVNRAGAKDGSPVFDTTGQRLVFKVRPASAPVHDGPALLSWSHAPLHPARARSKAAVPA